MLKNTRGYRVIERFVANAIRQRSTRRPDGIDRLQLLPGSLWILTKFSLKLPLVTAINIQDIMQRTIGNGPKIWPDLKPASLNLALREYCSSPLLPCAQAGTALQGLFAAGMICCLHHTFFQRKNTCSLVHTRLMQPDSIRCRQTH